MVVETTGTDIPDLLTQSGINWSSVTDIPGLLTQNGINWSGFTDPFRTVARVVLIIVSTGGIRWILWFSVHYAAAARSEICGVNTLSEENYTS